MPAGIACDRDGTLPAGFLNLARAPAPARGGRARAKRSHKGFDRTRPPTARAVSLYSRSTPNAGVLSFLTRDAIVILEMTSARSGLSSTCALLLLGASGLVWLGPAGCGSKPRTLETGYRYQPLNSTTVQRRAFYADPYSLEARRAEMERQERRDGAAGFGLGR